jgi:MinD superfamily P-loop ATPase
MIISVASGKGGTGKTTIATNLVLSIPDSIYLDADVEEPNGHLFLNPIILDEKVISRKIPEIDYNRCNFCGVCAKTCEFHAISVLPKMVLVFDELCHSCGACSYFCPEKAIVEVDKPLGLLRTGEILPEKKSFYEGRLNIGEMMASPLIAKLKQNCRSNKINIVDAPPGTSCSMVESVSKTDYCILVTEPTPFGLHDLKLSVEVLQFLEIPFGVVINKSQKESDLIEDYCSETEIPVLLKLPFDRRLAEAYSRGEPAVKLFPDLKNRFNELYEKILMDLRMRKLKKSKTINEVV